MHNSQPVSARKVRQHVAKQDAFLTKEVGPAIHQLLHNVGVAKTKIDALEAAPVVTAGTLWQRLRWLFRGQ